MKMPYVIRFFSQQNESFPMTSYNGIFPDGSSWDMVKQADKLSQPCYVTRTAVEEDIPGMISLFRSVFETYPSPVFDAEYLRTNIKTNRVLYKVAVHDDKIIGIASADKDQTNLNAEITDCVTNPQYRGQGILNELISELEEHLESKSFICLYTLCRATQAGCEQSLLPPRVFIFRSLNKQL